MQKIELDKVKNVPKRKKNKKPLRTPSHIIRICMVWCFVICLFLLSLPFINATIYITDDLKTTADAQQAYNKYATQEDIDSAEKDLQAALDGLVKDKNSKNDSTNESNSSAAVNTAMFDWVYHIRADVKSEDLQKLILKAKNTDRSIYTKESVEKLNTATINAQKILCATVSISQTALQLMFGGSIAELYGHGSTGGTIVNSLFAYALAFIPLIGFFAASFDKTRHIKHIISLIGSILCIIDIYFIIYPYLAIGSVFSIIMYIIIMVINIFSIYAKQQEDYIIRHPELEPEFSEKHPNFVKALINYKAFKPEPSTKNDNSKLQAAKNAQKHNTKKKK